MKIYSNILFTLLIVFFAASCKKAETKALENGEVELTLNNCGAPKNQGNTVPENFTVCFTKLVTESRCPIGAECIWEGYAQCEFSTNINGENKSFRLATLKNFLLSTDTVINGSKISLLTVLPYPDITKPASEPYRAVIKIEN